MKKPPPPQQPEVQIQKALQALKKHKPVAIPTETVYGLAAPVSDREGIKAIFTLKERPLFDPLIVHVNSTKMAKTYTRSWPPLCDLLAKHFWPGPLTMILPKSEKVDHLITAGHPHVGLRTPRHNLTLELISKLGEGLAAPSANKFGRTSPTCAQHVRKQLGNGVFILDGGDCLEGIESTVCEIREDKQELCIYRPGPRGIEEITALLLGTPFENYDLSYQNSPISPGHLKSHYQPEKPLVVYQGKFNREKALQEVKARWNSPLIWECRLPQNPYEAARVLYRTLMAPEAQSHDVILLYAPLEPLDDRWKGVEDRLQKAATQFIK